MDSLALCIYLSAAIPPVSFLLILWSLLAPKYSRRVTLSAALAFFAAEGIALSVLFLLGCSLEFVIGLLPVILYLPAILCFHLLSEKHVYFTALAWLLALLCDQSLAILRKLLIYLVSLRLPCCPCRFALAGGGPPPAAGVPIPPPALPRLYPGTDQRPARPPPSSSGGAAHPLFLFFVQHY